MFLTATLSANPCPGTSHKLGRPFGLANPVGFELLPPHPSAHPHHRPERGHVSIMQQCMPNLRHHQPTDRKNPLLLSNIQILRRIFILRSFDTSETRPAILTAWPSGHMRGKEQGQAQLSGEGSAIFQGQAATA